eukprot:CAMPEP_0115046366 /NCGR_PEP_ID=MMETSP0216-20121206/48709_1 /TAXON_ID=223996 /ORGANISM="Protocruzia adherens, Strain Boccale" /LENGTH=514 /DNA_ID=CAMNT_0002429439 /DNA_START=121 /DNA_END=1661 /DNA_ORIENTATION=-
MTSEKQNIINTLNNEFSSSGNTMTITEATVTYDSPTYPQDFIDANVKVILDLTENFALSQIFVFEAMERNLLHIVLRRSLSYEGSEAIGNNSLYMENKLLDIEDKLLFNFVKHFNWSKSLGIIKTSDLKMLKLAQDFKDRCEAEDPKIEISGEIIIELGITDNDQDVIGSRIRESLRLKNVRFVIMFADSETATNVIKAGVDSLNGSGYAWIVASPGYKFMAGFNNTDETSGLYRNGVVTFKMDNPLENLQTEVEAVLRTAFQGFNADPSIVGTALRQNYLNLSGDSSSVYSFSSDGSRIIDYNILNSQAGDLVEVGSWNSEVGTINIGQLLWPGNKTTPPEDQKSIITICLLYPKTVTGAEFEEGTRIKQGFDLAIEDITQDDTSNLKETYKFEGLVQDTQNDPTKAGEIIQNLQKQSFLGCVGPRTGEMTESILHASYAASYHKNFISYGSDWKKLTITDKYPSSKYSYLSTMQSISALSKAIVLYLSFNNWKQVAIIYTTTRERFIAKQNG